LADGGCWSTLAGQPTDDSELALALARSLVTKKCFDAGDVASAYARWLDSRPFDVGTTTRQALGPARAALKSGGNVAEAAMAAASRSSQSNGALMRISPLAIFAHAKPEEEVMQLARADAALTHPNPVCQDASAVYAASVAFALRSGADAKSVYDFALQLTSRYDIVKQIVERLAVAATHTPKFGENMGWVLIAFQNAFYQLLHAGSLREGLIATVRFGGDTDTTAAIAGALLGAVYGRGEIPTQWANKIYCCRPMADLAGVKRPRPAVYWPVDALSLAENLLLASPVAID
jgi:ADP-ribosylglycohydrolase